MVWSAWNKRFDFEGYSEYVIISYLLPYKESASQSLTTRWCSLQLENCLLGPSGAEFPLHLHVIYNR